MLSKYDNIAFVRMRTRIQEVARERGRTAAELARQMGLYRSNLSAMDAGRRTPSLRLIGRLSEELNCSVGDLLEIRQGPEAPVFRKASVERRLLERDRGVHDGAEKGWVPTALLAWQRYYGVRRRRR